ncbi:L,D-transpeptidase [Mycetohabitans endofungorum]|uniref:L,D-transpeptidase n=1 Tax=Mycetohabitans endofungorum TaxID=417203 RepID=UPI002B059FE3|nr:L,D-transpeptidase [Mycetohabitans endofungorum]
MPVPTQAPASSPTRPLAQPTASATHAPPSTAPVLPRYTNVPSALDYRKLYVQSVNRTLSIPAAAQAHYGQLLQNALAQAGLPDVASEFVAVVDRNPFVQAFVLMWRQTPSDPWQVIGASPVSTGMPGPYDHFITPLGVFRHTPDNMDFRAEGTFNDNGIRGYGARDQRIYDLGWTQAQRGWGNRATSQMRLQMHATDPDRLESLLGMRHSKGCIRIPGTLNTFLDHYGILDADYETRIREGQLLWVLKPNREASRWAGRYIVIVDGGATQRPTWSPVPRGAKVKHGAQIDTAD